MIIKSYEVKKNSKIFSNYNSFLLYGENPGLKKDIKNYIEEEFKKNDEDLEILKLYENEITDHEEIFYEFISSGSLFSKKKIIVIFESTDKIIKKIDHFHETNPEVIVFHGTCPAYLCLGGGSNSNWLILTSETRTGRPTPSGFFIPVFCDPCCLQYCWVLQG